MEHREYDDLDSTQEIFLPPTPSLVWHAIYKDGQHLSQVNGDTENPSESIDRSKLSSLMITTRGNEHIFTQYFKTGQQFIYRRRNMLRPGIGQLDIIHIIAIIENNIRHVTFIHENPITIVSSDFGINPATPLYYSIVPLAHDLIPIG